MPLDPYLAERLPLLHGLRRSPDAVPDAPEQERLAAFHTDPAPWTLPPVDVEDLTVPGRHGPVPVRTYRPSGTEPTGSLVWAHGGGFARGDLDWNEAHVVGAELAARGGVAVVSVGYRLARDGVRFPVPVDDVLDVWEWWHAHTARPRGRTALGGASAGAALAMAATLRAGDEGPAVPDDLLLAYPFVHFPVPALDDAVAAEMAALPSVLRFTPASIEAMVDGYVGRISDVPRLALPGHADVARLPRTVLVVCEYDDLRPSAELLERQLVACGVPVRSHLARGMLHGHLNRTPSLPEVSGSLDVLAEALRPPAAPRVRVVHLDAATFGALADGDLDAANAVSPVPLGRSFADPEWQGVWGIRRDQAVADPATAAWVTGVIWDEDLRAAVGRAGFHGPPDATGMVEIGYAVLPEHRRRGYARAALEALLDRAAREPDVRTVRVSIRPDNLASSTLAQQYGFVHVGEQWDEEDGTELIYERPADGTAHTPAASLRG